MHSLPSDPGRARNRDHGFTLIELLVVVVIIAMLGGIVFAVANRVKRGAETAVCASNLRQVGTALLSYASENHNHFPSLRKYDKPGEIWTKTLALEGHLGHYESQQQIDCGSGVWTCPGCVKTSVNFGGFGVAQTSIFRPESLNANDQVSGNPRKLTEIPDPANTWLVGDAAKSPDDLEKGWFAVWNKPGRWKSNHCPAERHNGKANVLMVDGHLESLTIDEITERELTQPR